MIQTQYKLLWRMQIDTPRPSNFFTFRCFIEKIYYQVERTQKDTVIRYRPYKRIALAQNFIQQELCCTIQEEVTLFDGDMLCANIINPSHFTHNIKTYFTIKNWVVTPFLRTCDLIRFLHALPILLWKFKCSSYGNKHLRKNIQTLSRAINIIQKDSIEHERQRHSAILGERK